jgi:hypothetical protein
MVKLMFFFSTLRAFLFVNLTLEFFLTCGASELPTTAGLFFFVISSITYFSILELL